MTYTNQLEINTDVPPHLMNDLVKHLKAYVQEEAKEHSFSYLMVVSRHLSAPYSKIWVFSFHNSLLAQLQALHGHIGVRVDSWAIYNEHELYESISFCINDCFYKIEPCADANVNAMILKSTAITRHLLTEFRVQNRQDAQIPIFLVGLEDMKQFYDKVCFRMIYVPLIKETYNKIVKRLTNEYKRKSKLATAKKNNNTKTTNTDGIEHGHRKPAYHAHTVV